MPPSRNPRTYKFLATIASRAEPQVTYSVSHSATSYSEAKNFFTETFHATEYVILSIFAPAEPLLSAIFSEEK